VRIHGKLAAPETVLSRRGVARNVRRGGRALPSLPLEDSNGDDVRYNGARGTDTDTDPLPVASWRKVTCSTLDTGRHSHSSLLTTRRGRLIVIKNTEL
jgi:hypothetical protein